MLNRGETLKRPHADAKNWYKDRYQYVLVWRNMLFIISALALAGVVISVLAISELTPQKTVEPFVIQVDEKTGMTQVVNPVGIKELNALHVLDEYFVAQYVKARESYDALALDNRAHTVRLMSVSSLYRSYYDTIDPKNQNSLYVRFKTETVRNIKINSIVFLDGETAQVRMTASDVGATPAERGLIATMKFEYAKMNLTTVERYINPLGFRVVNYNLVEENK